jgi:hypothetical protein
LSDIRRVEDSIHAVIDTLLLFDPEMFKKSSRWYKVIRHLVRMILTIGPYGIGTIVMYWKEFTNFLYNRFADFQPALPLPSSKNFFYWALWTHPSVLAMRLGGNMNKLLCEQFAHLSSTRHFGTGDRHAAKKSLEGFFKAINTPYHVDIDVLNRLHTLAQRVGEKCVFLAKDSPTRPHISLSCAGSYYETVKDGGRGKEIRDSVTEILKYRPTENESIQTPFGEVHCPKGESRWRYWGRPEVYTAYPDIDFGEVITEEVFAEQNLYYQGFDEFIGNQILICAYLSFKEWEVTGLGIPCRVLTVPEPGYKARIVTTGPYWLNVLQQSIAHPLKTILGGHPSARSSLLKTDQAWQSLYLMSGKSYPQGSSCLSSDLKEATDYIPKVVGIQLLSGFIQGVGLKSNLVQDCLNLLRMDRTFISPIGISDSQVRGIMMGEPLTKAILTILNLVVEEDAMRRYLNIKPEVCHYESPPWRTYHVGGDDHLAIGPVSYLNHITDSHLRAGSQISAGKHGISNRVVRYCEKVIEVSKIFSGFDVRKINDSTEHYEQSPFVDSVKVRLLSPLTRATDVSSDRNVAIGKGLSLGRTLKWLNPDHFSPKWVRMVRDRFFERMGSLLPDRTSGVYWQLMLPSYWGGLDLYMKGELPRLYTKVPELTLSVMDSYIRDEKNSHHDVKLLRKLLTNYSYRGFRLNETEVEAMNSHLEMIIKQLPTALWWEIRQMFDPEGQLSAKDISSAAHADGWRGEEDVIDELMRPILFKEILLGREKPSAYNTQKLKMRYAKLWDLIYRGPPSLSEEEFIKAVLAKPKMPYYKVGYPEEIHFVSDRGYIYKSALDDALHGMPVLSTRFPFA